MNWFVFAIFAFLACALDAGAQSLFSIRLLGIETFPSFMLILTGFVALWAPQPQALWAGLILGLLTDCLVRYPGAGPDNATYIALLGPYALGYLLAAYTVLQIRGVFKRESPLALAIALFAAGMLGLLLTVMLITGRGVYTEPIPGWRGVNQLARAILCLVYSSFLAVLLGWVLERSRPLWKFDAGPSAAGRR